MMLVCGPIRLVRPSAVIIVIEHAMTIVEDIEVLWMYEQLQLEQHFNRFPIWPPTRMEDNIYLP